MSIDLLALAERFGTPLYAYDFDALADRASRAKRALGGRVSLYYAVKANPNRELLASARKWADGLDVSSGGEIALAEAAGWPASSMSFAGPAKSDAELEIAARGGCGSISAESAEEINRAAAAGRRVGARPRLSLRVNPSRLEGRFALKMGGRPTQFGIDEEDAAEAFLAAAAAVRAGEIEFAGVHVYAGTQCLDADAIVAAASMSATVAETLCDNAGLPLPCLNLGGGFGVPYYEGQEELDLDATGAGIGELVEGLASRRPGIKVVIELGRYLAGPVGWYIVRVVSVKRSRGKLFAIVDGGMHHNLSASGNLGQTLKRNYRALNLSNPLGAMRQVELAGCLCTPIDLLGFGMPLSEPRVGDYIALANSGAYGLSSSSILFLGHDTPREIAIDGGSPRIVRERRGASEMA